MAKKTPANTIGFIANVGIPRSGEPTRPSIIPTGRSEASATSAPKQASQWVEATELPSDEALAAAMSKVPVSVLEAFGYSPKKSS